MSLLQLVNNRWLYIGLGRNGHLSPKTIITVVIIDLVYRAVKGGRINCFELIGPVMITFHVACNEAKPINWSEAVQLKGSER